MDTVTRMFKSVKVLVQTDSTYGMTSEELETACSQPEVKETILSEFSAFTYADAIHVAMQLASEQRPICFSITKSGYGYEYTTDGEKLELTYSWRPVERSEKSYFYGGQYE